MPEISKRDHRIVTRVSEREWKILHDRARDCGLGTSTFLRQLGLGNVPRARPRLRDRELLRELARVGGQLGRLRSLAESRQLPEPAGLEEALRALVDAARRIR